MILAYLLFTIIEADYQLQRAGEYYTSLGVPLDVTEKALQSRFRRLTVQYHPDKVPASDQAKVESLFVYLKHARDTIADPARRFAYDRFGPDMLSWQCKTIKDFVNTGVRNIAVYYVATGAGLIMAGVLGYLQSGKFWRYLVLATMFTLELYIMTRPYHPAFLTSFINPILASTGRHQPLLPFQLLALLRKFAITIFIAISQLQPLFARPADMAAAGDKAVPQLLERNNALTMAIAQEVNRIMNFELTQFGAGSPTLLVQSLKEWLVQNTIRNDPEIKQAMAAALNQRREASAAGPVPVT